YRTSATMGRTATRRRTSRIRRWPRRARGNPADHRFKLSHRRTSMSELTSGTTHRRGFLGRIAAGAAALGLGGLVTPLEAIAPPTHGSHGVSPNPEFEAWLNKITGKHKMIFDIPEPNGGFG